MSEHNVRPDAEGTSTGWTLGAGASKTAAVDPGNPINHDDGITYIKMASGSAVTLQSFSLEPPTFTSLALNGINYGVRSNVHWLVSPESLFVFARMNGVDGSSSSLVHTITNTYFTFTGALARPGGGQWSWADLFNSTLELGISNPTALDGEARVTSVWLIPDGVESPEQITQAREVPSRRLWNFRRANPVLDTPVPLDFLDVELLDLVPVSHYGLPLQLALGNGTKVWQRPLFRAMKMDLDLKNFTINATLKDVRAQLLTFMDIGRSLKTGGTTHDGIARLDVGNTRQWTRASKAWVEDPADGFHKELQDNYEKQGPEGMIFEWASQNGIARSSFIQQLTGWTTTSGVTAEAAVDNQPLFGAEVTGYVAKIVNTVATVGPTSPLSVSYSANAHISVSVDYRENEASTALKVRIRRAFDGRFWDGAAWQVAAQDLAVTASTVNARALFENIDVGGNATTISIRPVVTVAGKTAYILHTQVEEQRWASATRIVTDAAAVTRAIDALAISNDTTIRCWNNERGSGVFEYIPKWAPTAVRSTDLFYFFDLVYDADNRFRLYYRASDMALVFEVKRAGVAVEATMSWTPTRDEPVLLGYRWTSSEGELDLAPYTVSVFVAGVKGTDAVSAGGMPVEDSLSTMYIGADDSGASSADGVMRYILLTQQVLHDGEMARGGP